MLEKTFVELSELFADRTGIAYPRDKRGLLESRLQRRLLQRAVPSLESYAALLRQPGEEPERLLFVDALTTHETSFFREPPHFEFLERWLHTPRTGPFRAWSAACSTGEEVYSLAMTLAPWLADWEVVGTDVSTRAVERARRGLYPMERAAQIPPRQLKAWCLKGVGTHEGCFRIGAQLRERTRFQAANLFEPQAHLGRFDLVMLRNVLIYFEPEQRRAVVQNVVDRLAPGGILMLGHAESSAGLHPRLVSLQPSVFRLEPAS